ncbi:MAG: hypothetical protein DMG61_16870 [Acidobacteria bacterium]|nr:MAG: hypothetical protein DMG61_16870 [Acidobacteriota bacterium]
MYSNSKNLVRVLETELRFLDKGGYRNPEMWRQQFVFLDSPTCVHPARSGRPEACSDCPLIGFVPRARRTAPVPCHHIPLTREGFTVDSLSRWGTHEETENALRGWLMEKIEALNGNEEHKADKPGKDEEMEAFCMYMAG